MTETAGFAEADFDALFETPPEEAIEEDSHVVQDDTPADEPHPLPRGEDEASDDGDDSVTSAGAESESGTPSSDTVDFLGRALDRDYAERVVGFMDWAATNPRELQLLNQILSGELVAVAPSQLAPPAPAPAPVDDLDDIDEPVRRRLLELERAVADARDQARVASESTRAANLASANAAVEQAKKTFAKRYAIDDTQLAKIEASLFQTQALPGYVRQAGNVLTGTERALEATYFAMPGSLEKIVAQRMVQQREDAKRQRKQAAVGGSSGSVSRNKPEPRSKEEHLAAAIEEIANARLGVTEPGA